MDKPTQRLKRAVIKEELVALTGDFVKAAILNQLVYWSERVDDFDKFILEERQRAREQDEAVPVELAQGWIYKKAEELADETMLNLSKSNMMNHIKALVEAGWIDQRRNPRNRMDRVYQYRVNIAGIQQALLLIGYSLEGYRVPLNFIVEAATELRRSDSKHRSSETELRSTDLEPRGSDSVPRSSETEQQYQRLLTETTNTIVDELVHKFTSSTHEDISTDKIHLLLTQYGPDKVEQAIEIIVAMPEWTSGAEGALTAALRDGWKKSSPTRNAQRRSTNGQMHSVVRDERYDKFYRLFPDT